MKKRGSLGLGCWYNILRSKFLDVGLGLGGRAQYLENDEGAEENLNLK